MRHFILHGASCRRIAVFLLLILGNTACAQNPTTLYMYPYGSTHGETFIASLAGVVARTRPEVFMGVPNSSPAYDPEFWVDQYIADNPGTQKVWRSSLPFYIDRYRNELNGYVLYNDATINEATSVAGALGAAMVHESLLPSIRSDLSAAGLGEVADARSLTAADVYQQYGHLLNKEMIFRQNPGFNQQLRSFAILNAGFVFNSDAGPLGSDGNGYLAAQEDHTRVFGWGFNNSEYEFFSTASRNNLMGVPADHLHGSAAIARLPADIPSQPAHTPTDISTDPKKHYVAFVMSDGDNVQWLTNDFARSDRWFGSGYRGEFDFTFDMSPSLADVNPVALKYFYDQAAQDQHKTFFVTAGGQGLSYPSRVPDIDGFMDATVASMRAVDQNIISVLDEGSVDISKLRQMVSRPEVMGMMLKTGPAYAGHQGQIYWQEDKPIVSVKYTLWDGFDTVDSISSALNSAPTDPLHNQASYSIVNVHPWSTSLAGGGTGNPMANVQKIVQGLDDAVAVVTLEELIIHLSNNADTLGDPIGRDLLGNGGFEIASPSNPARPRDWYYAPATSWISGEDSTGEGQHAVAIHEANADWRSVQFEVLPGEELEFSFDFQFVGVPDGSGFRADARFFDEAGHFVGETVRFFDAADYAPGEWHSFSTIAPVPDGAPNGDVRFSTYFGDFLGGQVLIDNAAVLSAVSEAIEGDLDGDGLVNSADLDIVRAWWGTEVTPGDLRSGDATGDGKVDSADLDIIRANWGAVATAVPEPGAYVMLLMAVLTLYCRRHAVRLKTR